MCRSGCLELVSCILDEAVRECEEGGLRLLRPGANETFYVGRKRNNEQCCPTVLMVLMCCVGVTSSADLWDDIQRITVPSSIATLLSSKGVLR